MFREHERAVSVVVLDLQMPVMSGEEVLAKLRTIKPDVPVILLSGFDEAEAMRFAASEAAGFLQKALQYSKSGKRGWGGVAKTSTEPMKAAHDGRIRK